MTTTPATAGIIRKAGYVLGACTIATTATLLTAPAAHATTNCTVTQVPSSPTSTQFSNQTELQAILSTPTNACAGFDGTLTVNLTGGFTLNGSALTWAGGSGNDRDLVVNGQTAATTTLDGNSNSAVLDTLASTGTVSLSNITLTRGRIAGNGAAIAAGGGLTVSDSILSDSTSAGFGGGVYGVGAVTVTNSTISGNQSYQGGGIFSGDVLTVSDSTISGNISYETGGGICSNGTATITDSTLSGNVTSTGAGGGLAASGTTTLTRSTVSGNTSDQGGGGGIAAFSDLSVVSSTISSNTSAGSGGGIDGVNVTITDSSIAGNETTNENGGGVRLAGTLTMTDSIVTSNTANNNQGRGGGISSGETLITGSTITGNTAGSGGGISSGDPSANALTLTNSTVADNSASGGSGGGILANGTATVRFSTIVDNTGSAGSQLHQLGSDALTSVGTIIGYDSQTAPSCAGFGSYVGTYNATLTGESSCAFPSDGTNFSSTWAQFKLGALAVNDNPSGAQTMLPAVGSSLIDIVPNAAGQAAIGPNAIDQRGVTRTGSFWVGAAQRAATPVPPIKAQKPIDNCAAAPRRIRSTGPATLLKPGCRTNAGKTVGVRVNAQLRGDLVYFRLYCAIPQARDKQVSKNVSGSYCKKGSLKIWTNRSPVALRVVWSAPATKGYTAYSKTKRYRA